MGDADAKQCGRQLIIVFLVFKHKVVRVLHCNSFPSEHCCLCLHGNCTFPGPWHLAQRRLSPVTPPSLHLLSTPLNMTPSLCMYNGSIVIYLFSYHTSADTMSLDVEGNQQIFTSPNQPHLPNVPPPSFDLPQSSTAFFKPLWNFEQYPYLAFIPQKPNSPELISYVYGTACD